MPGDPVLPYRSHQRFGWLGLLIIPIMIAAIVAYKKYKSAKDGETKEANGKNDCANQSDEEKVSLPVPES
ncbi:hypothetical protein GDO81_014778 [Engystomops pustulosus]|uniref:Uncharacterized protein n=2 Tax=Engystomops pustulosus TaxID=76066 RepID=A0AAV7AKV0_ENGPU|nr:hypothetical protein GDO81_014778 [Engystomops pustulosus]